MSRSRKSFRRTKVSTLEKVLSWSIVGGLAAIGAAIGIKGRHFDPGLYSVRPEALKSTAFPAAGELREAKASAPAAATEEPGTSSPDSESSADGYGEPAAAPAAARKPLDLPGATPMGDTEFYSADTLYEKINGRAPAYLEFQFQELRSRTFAVPKQPGSYVDVYEYRMDSPVNAFGIFSMERDPTGQTLDFAPDGYSGEMGFFFRQGSCYLQVLASDQKPETVAFAKSVATALAKSIPANDAGLEARRRLPVEGLLSESVVYTQDNAQGQAFLKEVFQAEYKTDGKKLTFFLMVTTPEAAAKAWEDYFAFSSRYGGKAQELPDIAGAKVFQATNFGKSKLIYQRHGELGGVLDSEDPAAAQAFLEKILGM
jgi:hypothetical protein